LIRTALALAAAGFSATAQAQLAPGRSGGSTVSYFGAEQAMKELTVFGRCYARNKPDKAWSLIAERPASREEAQTFRKLFKGESEMCLIPGTTLTMPLEYIRGVIAEGLLREQVAVPAAHRLSAPTLAEVRSLTDIARCFVAANPAKARAILETKPGSRAEYDAVSAMINDFAPCTPAGAQVRADATLIRYRLAEGLLRLAPPAAPGS
jgi:hypothetical protein